MTVENKYQENNYIYRYIDVVRDSMGICACSVC